MSASCLTSWKYWELHEEWNLFVAEWINLYNDLAKKSGKAYVILVIPVIGYAPVINKYCGQTTFIMLIIIRRIHYKLCDLLRK